MIYYQKATRTNIKKYMIATLFNAPSTMDNFYTQLVNHDMHSDKWFEMLDQKKREEEALTDIRRRK